jgi:hypothetical protein
MKSTTDTHLNRSEKGWQTMPRVFWAFITAVAIAATTAAVAKEGFTRDGRRNDDRDDDHERGSYVIGLWGDLPYSDVQATTGVPNPIADMNWPELAFAARDGDLKAGNGTTDSTTPTICSDALYTQGPNYLNSLKAPAILTPGDDDWTDCDRPSNGGFPRSNVWTTSARHSSALRFHKESAESARKSSRIRFALA